MNKQNFGHLGIAPIKKSILISIFILTTQIAREKKLQKITTKNNLKFTVITNY
jgi:hypothetical protein